MNQRESLLILFEATADLPDTRHLKRARRWAEKRLETLRIRYARMRATRFLNLFYRHLPDCPQCADYKRARDEKYCAVGKLFVDAYVSARAEAGQTP